MTENRLNIFESMEEYRKILQPDDKDWSILEVGIDGDEFPSGNHKYFGKGNSWSTLDFLAKLNPDIVDDISVFNDDLVNKYDLIICSQVLEHVFKFQDVIINVFNYLKAGGYAIFDCPFEFPYHGLPAYDDYWRISDTALLKLMKDVGFEVAMCKRIGPLTTALGRKLKE